MMLRGAAQHSVVWHSTAQRCNRPGECHALRLAITPQPHAAHSPAISPCFCCPCCLQVPGLGQAVLDASSLPEQVQVTLGLQALALADEAVRLPLDELQQGQQQLSTAVVLAFGGDMDLKARKHVSSAAEEALRLLVGQQVQVSTAAWPQGQSWTAAPDHCLPHQHDCH